MINKFYENSNVMLRDQREDRPSKTCKNLDFSSDSAWILPFASQPLSASYDIKLRLRRAISGAKRNTTGSRAVKMSRDLWRRARCIACRGSKGTPQSKNAYAQLVDTISRLVAHNKLWDTGMADSKTRPARWELPGQISTHGGENLNGSGD